MNENFDLTNWFRTQYITEDESSETSLILSPNDAFKIYDFLKLTLDEEFTKEFPIKSNFYYQLDSFLKKGKLKENQIETTIGDLEVGKNIELGSNLPNPNSDTSTRIHNENALESWKKNKDPKTKVIIVSATPFNGWMEKEIKVETVI